MAMNMTGNSSSVNNTWPFDYFLPVTISPTNGSLRSSPTWQDDVPPIALAADRYITPIWYVIGITGNLLSARIWFQRRMRQNNSSAIYLATLSLTDMVFLLLHVVQELRYAWYYRTLSVPVVCEGYFLLYMAAQYLSPLLVLGFTVERWIAVCRPFKKEQYCTEKRACLVVAVLVIISVLLSAIQAYFWTYDPVTNECEVRREAWHGHSPSLWTVWSWTTEATIFICVPLVILVFNVLVICEIKKLTNSGQCFLPGQNRQTQQTTSAATTAMLLSVSFYVIFTTLPPTLVYCLVSQFPPGSHDLSYSAKQQDPTWQNYFTYITSRKFIEEISLSHYACNFFLYLITGKQFRKALLELLKRPLHKLNTARAYSEISRYHHDNLHTQMTMTHIVHNGKNAEEEHGVAPWSK